MTEIVSQSQDFSAQSEIHDQQFFLFTSKCCHMRQKDYKQSWGPDANTDNGAGFRQAEVKTQNESKYANKSKVHKQKSKLKSTLEKW